MTNMGMTAGIKSGLVQSFPEKLVDELLAAYIEAKRNYYLGGLRLSEVEGGRFCEASLRMLEYATIGKFTPLGKQLSTDVIILRLSQISKTLAPESVRIHIPRALRVVYDIRNNRDAAHLGDNIDPNNQDATLVVSVLDWILAEFIRIYHDVLPEVAQKMVENVITRRAPAIQDFEGFLKVLKPNLQAGDYILLLLYQRGIDGALYGELEKWVRPKMRPNLRRTLERLVDDYAYVHFDGSKYILSGTGIMVVEKNKIYELQ